MPCTYYHEAELTPTGMSPLHQSLLTTLQNEAFFPAQRHFFHCHTATHFQLQLHMSWGAGGLALSAKE